ncbi:HipA N-terminal domain-containing protein [Chitinophaga sp. 22321]|uniref:HipA N-terminal domain-containing protein n=1 Tax=Chitinophaga hostae TaxID=2831022 RepID=A0ABS5IU20_9BACT|nr:HipA N-terminal domain-containing protein [Chitinophaga hostae]MBS0026449.1 HipA N-terminal domain-containing protein [Chitinophaga hostae]
MGKTGKVYYGNTLAGFISETDAGYEYLYDKDYLADPSAKPISLTLPISQYAYHSKTLFAFFDGLIPEGWLLDIAKEHWKIKSNDRFELLLLTCQDTIGAVTVVRGTKK